MYENIRIVLVGTTHPGNIGATARAMKNMCLESLVLVAPKIYPSAEATARASGADNLLARARVCQTLDEALADCSLVVGASARLRSIPWPTAGARECAARLWRQAASGPVAVVFGREHSGLTNAELDRCHQLLHLPANPDYASLNLAAAVQVIAYEIRMTALGAPEPAQSEALMATVEEMRGFYDHLEQTLTRIGFLDPGNPRQLMRRMRRLFNRLGLEREEVSMLRGVLRAAARRPDEG